jgi:autotransporter-associated beta strand protein
MGLRMVSAVTVRRLGVVAIVFVALAVASRPAVAVVFTWNGGTGAWNTTGTNWNASTATWPAAGADNDALFAGTAGTVTVTSTGGGITANDIRFSTSGYNITSSTLTLITTPTITVDTNITGTISSSIAGSAGLAKSGAGTLTLTASNSFTGNVTNNAGTLVVANSNALGSGSKQLISQGGSRVVQLSGGVTIGSNVSLVMSSNSFDGGGLSSVSGSNAVQGNITFSFGNPALNISSATGSTLTISGSVVYSPGSAGRPLHLGGASTSVNTISGNISEAGGSSTGMVLNKQGVGAWVLTGSNSYTGATNINGGVLVADNANALGAASGTISFGGGTLRFTANSAAQDWATRIRSSTSAISLDTSGQNVTLAGAIVSSNTAGLTKLGAGELTLSGSSSYAGGNTIQSGTLALGNANALGGSSGSLAVNGGVLDLRGFSPTVGTLSGSSGALITSASSATLTASSAANSTYAGVISGSVALTKSGTGLLTLSGSNNYTGATTVNGGTLAVNGSLGNTAVSVAAAAWLQGTGAIEGSVNVLGTLSPGNSPGVLTVGSVVLGGSSATVIEINNLVRGTDYDGVTITGTSSPLQYGGLLSLSFGNGSAFANGTTFDIFNFTGAISGSYASVTSTGFYSGTWASIGSGTYQLVSGAQTLTFDPSLGDIIVVPEPAAIGLVGIGLAAFGWVRGRRRRGPTPS